MKSKEFSRDAFKTQCLLMGLALVEAPDMEMEEVAERFTRYHYGEKEFAEARVAVRAILELDAPPPPQEPSE